MFCDVIMYLCDFAATADSRAQLFFSFFFFAPFSFGLPFLLGSLFNAVRLSLFAAIGAACFRPPCSAEALRHIGAGEQRMQKADATQVIMVIVAHTL